MDNLHDNYKLNQKITEVVDLSLVVNLDLVQGNDIHEQCSWVLDVSPRSRVSLVFFKGVEIFKCALEV